MLRLRFAEPKGRLKVVEKVMKPHLPKGCKILVEEIGAKGLIIGLGVFQIPEVYPVSRGPTVGTHTEGNLVGGDLYVQQKDGTVLAHVRVISRNAPAVWHAEGQEALAQTLAHAIRKAGWYVSKLPVISNINDLRQIGRSTVLDF